MLTAKSHNDFYFEHFGNIKSDLPGAKLQWLSRARTEAIERFLDCGYPTMNVEEWKHTNLLKQSDFFPVMGEPSVNEVAERDIEALLLDSIPSHRMVFVNGFFCQRLSDVGALPAGLRLTTAGEMLVEQPELMEEHWGQPWGFLEHRLSGEEDPKPHSMVALNMALSPGGPVIHVDRDVSPELPIHLVNVVVSEASGVMSQPRTLLIAGEGSGVTLLETYIGGGVQPHMVNALTQVRVMKGATVRHYKHQGEGPNGFHLATNLVRLDSGSTYSGCVFSNGGGISRNEARVRLEGQRGDCTLDGIYLGRGQQHMDNWTRVDHVAPYGETREMYKGVLDEKAEGAFQGKVRIWPEAIASRAQQLNKNLLLSEDARAFSKPELEILNDDVQCAHGSTIGDLDRECLFYLRSRGVDEFVARKLLIEAFVGEVIDRAPDVPIRAHFRKLFYQWFSQAS